MRHSKFGRHGRKSIKFFLPLFTVCLFALWFPANSFAESLFVKSDRTKLQAEASSRSEVVVVLKKGDQVQVIEKGARFFKVSTSAGAEGWVFKFKLKAKSSSGSSSGGGGNLFSAVGGKQSFSANESSSASSIRGLSPTATNYAKSSGVSPEMVEAVKFMEQLQATDAELERFQKDGRLGEFAN